MFGVLRGNIELLGGAVHITLTVKPQVQLGDMLRRMAVHGTLQVHASMQGKM